MIEQKKGFLIANCRKPICFIYKGKSDEDTIKKAKKQLLSMCQKWPYGHFYFLILHGMAELFTIRATPSPKSVRN